MGPFTNCAGVQGAIYELKSPDGKDSGQLLKVLKFKAVLPITGNDIGALHIFLVGQPAGSLSTLSAFLVEIMSMHKPSCEPLGLKREWIIGQHLNKLRGPKGELQGKLATVILSL